MDPDARLKTAVQLTRNAHWALFDMDGTLVNSVGVWNQVDDAVIRVIRGDGGALQQPNQRDRVLKNFPSAPNPYAEYCNWLRVTYRSSWSTEQIIAYRTQVAHAFLASKVDYKPYADALLHRLRARGTVLGICSTTNRANMAIHRTENARLNAKAPIDALFTLVLTREDAPVLKPDPGIYRLALQKLGADPARTVVFEDTLVGVQAAKAAGLPCIAVPDPYAEADQAAIRALADAYLLGYDELLPYLE